MRISLLIFAFINAVVAVCVLYPFFSVCLMDSLPFAEILVFAGWHLPCQAAKTSKSVKKGHWNELDCSNYLELWDKRVKLLLQ